MSSGAGSTAMERDKNWQPYSTCVGNHAAIDTLPGRQLPVSARVYMRMIGTFTPFTWTIAKWVATEFDPLCTFHLRPQTGSKPV